MSVTDGAGNYRYPTMNDEKYQRRMEFRERYNEIRTLEEEIQFTEDAIEWAEDKPGWEKETEEEKEKLKGLYKKLEDLETF